MRICTKDSRHKNFIVTAVESHDWVVDEDGVFIEDKGCHDSRIHDGSEWLCAECGAHTLYVNSVEKMSIGELRRLLIDLRNDSREVVRGWDTYWKNYPCTNDPDLGCQLDGFIKQLRDTANRIVEA